MDVNFCLEVAARGALPLAGAAVAAWVLRRSSAAARHAVWAAGAAGALAVPGLRIGAPAWPIPLPSHAASGVVAPAELPRDEPAGENFRLAVEPLALVDGPAGEEAPARPVPSEPAVFRAPAERFSWSAVALWAWLAGAMVVAGWGVVGRLRLRGLRRRSSPLAGGRQAEVAGELVGRLCPGRRVVVARSAGGHSPMTWGTWRPVVLLPAGSGEWPEELFRSVVAHELAHVRRLDTLWQTVAGLACVLYWFNPLAWLAAGRLRVERELACDDLVLSLGERPSAYASHLLAIARHPRAPLPALAMARPSRLEGRLRAILDPSLDHRPLRRRSMLAIAVAGLLLTLPLAGARPARAVQEPAPAREEPAGTTVTGRVVDPQGKPVSNARVAMLGLNLALSPPRHEVLAQTTTGPDGTFPFEWPRYEISRDYSLHFIANAPGFSLGWVNMNQRGEPPKAEVRLRPAGEVKGKVIFGEKPVAGARLHVQSLEALGLGVRWPDRGEGPGASKEIAAQLAGIWPTVDATGADGSFRVVGIAPDVAVTLQVDAEAFERQNFRLVPEWRNEPVLLALQPQIEIHGQVTLADTGEPAEGAIVWVASTGNGSPAGIEQRTGPDGRYSVFRTRGHMIGISVKPPGGSDYLEITKYLDYTQTYEHCEVDLALPRGVPISGRVVEEKTGRPVAGALIRGDGPAWERASLEGERLRTRAVRTDAEGRYNFVSAPGPGYFTVVSENPDYIREAVTEGQLTRYWPARPGQADEIRLLFRDYSRHVHAFLAYDAKPGETSRVADFALCRGSTLSGQVVGPDGKPVEFAEITTTLSHASNDREWRGSAKIPVHDGRFELHGLSPGQAVRCIFHDAKNRLGATVELADTMATEGPVVVRLQPCGQAKLRLVDTEGEPLWYGCVDITVVASPGYPARLPSPLQPDEPRAAEAQAYDIDPRRHSPYIPVDEDGRLVLQALVPGATYRIYPHSLLHGLYKTWREFTAKPGEALDLGDIVCELRPR